MSSRAEGHLRPSPGRPDLSRTSSNVSSRSAQSARSAGSARESLRQGGTGSRPANSTVQMAQSRPLDQGPTGRGADPRPSGDFSAPALRNMDRETPTQQQQQGQQGHQGQQQRQQQIPSAGPLSCARCRACLASEFCARHIEDPHDCITIGLLLAGACGVASGVCIGLHGLPC